jgi:hypothetical protein
MSSHSTPAAHIAVDIDLDAGHRSCWSRGIFDVLIARPPCGFNISFNICVNTGTCPTAPAKHWAKLWQ